MPADFGLEMAFPRDIPEETMIRTFRIERMEVGRDDAYVVAWGVQFDGGLCAVMWLGPTRAVSVYADIKDAVFSTRTTSDQIEWQ